MRLHAAACVRTRVMRIVLLGLLVACTRPKPTPVTTPPPASEERDSEQRTREIEACRARCDMVVGSRHDACGRHGARPYPAWCAESNARMYDECYFGCD